MTDMKRKYTAIAKIAMITGVLAFTSCDSNIDLLPTDLISSENAFENYNDIDRGVVGGYSNMAYQNTLMISSYTADENRWALDNASRNYGAALHRWDFNPGTTEFETAWVNMYNVIDRVNRALQSIDNVTLATDTERANIGRLRGELLAIRAFNHFELLRWYAEGYEAEALGVPLMTEPEVFAKPSRSTFGEVITAVLADIQQAETLIPSSFATNGRFSLGAVYAMKARVALYAKNYELAATAANQALDFKGRTLPTGDNYRSMWRDGNTSEVYLSLLRADNNSAIRLIYTDLNTDVFYSPSVKLVNSFDQANDIRYGTTVFVDNAVAANRERIKVNKYPGQTLATDIFNNVKVLRASEMYLIIAESSANLNNLAAGTAALNTLRAARITGYVPQVFTSAAALIDATLAERFKELAFEGHRLFDLRRLNRPINRLEEDTQTGGAIPQNLAVDALNYRFPVPQREIFANPNVLQNSGY